jgi:hypothetical protein
MSLTKKNIKFKWTTENQQAFDSLKNSLAREVVLAYLDSTPTPIQGNLLILKQDTPSQKSSLLERRCQSLG